MSLEFRERCVVAGDTFLQVNHVYLKGTNFEIGAQLGDLARHRHQIEKKAAPDALIAHCQKKYLQGHYPIHWERMKGFARSYGQSPEESACDFSVFGRPLGQSACSAVYYPPHSTALQHGVLSRNLDFEIPRELPPAQERMHMPFSRTYIMELHPDVGHASLTLFCYEVFGQALEGINSEGLTVVHLADEDTAAEFPQAATNRPAVGLNEFMPVQLLLDTCSTVQEAKEVLLLNKHYYMCVPVHLLIADRQGNSFVWEYGSVHNSEYILEGGHQPQIITNFLLHRYSETDVIPETDPGEYGAVNRFKILQGELRNASGLYTMDFIRGANRKVFCAEPFSRDCEAAPAGVRTLFHNIYDIDSKTVSMSFYLAEDDAPGTEIANVVRSDYFDFYLG